MNNDDNNSNEINRKSTKLIWRAIESEKYEIARNLMKQGVEKDYLVAYNGRTILHEVYLRSMQTRINKKDFTFVRDLIVYYRHFVNTRAVNGMTPLLCAIQHGKIEDVSLLVLFGADYTMQDNQNRLTCEEVFNNRADFPVNFTQLLRNIRVFERKKIILLANQTIHPSLDMKPSFKKIANYLF